MQTITAAFMMLVVSGTSYTVPEAAGQAAIKLAQATQGLTPR